MTVSRREVLRRAGVAGAGFVALGSGLLAPRWARAEEFEPGGEEPIGGGGTLPEPGPVAPPRLVSGVPVYIEGDPGGDVLGVWGELAVPFAHNADGRYFVTGDNHRLVHQDGGFRWRQPGGELFHLDQPEQGRWYLSRLQALDGWQQVVDRHQQNALVAVADANGQVQSRPITMNESLDDWAMRVHGRGFDIGMVLAGVGVGLAGVALVLAVGALAPGALAVAISIGVQSEMIVVGSAVIGVAAFGLGFGVAGYELGEALAGPVSHYLYGNWYNHESIYAWNHLVYSAPPH
jgi:hypothetical protein